MTGAPSEEHSDARLAARLAEQAGRLLLRLRRDSGLSGRELGKRGDAESNALLLRELTAARPDDAVLSEESADSAQRLSARRVWIIDPLDGTREYGMEGRTDWAVHVALWEWDSAAPVGVALAAGLHASRIDGSALVYNSEHPYLPDLLICRAELAEPLLDAIASVAAA